MRLPSPRLHTMGDEQTLAWVASKEVDGEWLQAAVVSQSDEAGMVTLETLESKEKHTCAADGLLLVNELPEDGVENMTRLNCARGGPRKKSHPFRACGSPFVIYLARRLARASTARQLAPSLRTRSCVHVHGKDLHRGQPLQLAAGR